jgi:menaquinol-cytochrome c reductase iron-sulfur subunit
MAGSHQISRRDFVKLTTAVVGTVIGAGIGLPAIGYMISPALRAGGKEAWISIGALEKMPVGEPYAFAFTRTQVNGWERTSTSYGGFVLRKSEDPKDLVILSSRCTHLGCQINWRAESKAFVCPCHDASFDINGKVIDGPPPRPLDVYDTYKLDEAGNLLILVKEG